LDYTQVDDKTRIWAVSNYNGSIKQHEYLLQIIFFIKVLHLRKLLYGD